MASADSSSGFGGTRRALLFVVGAGLAFATSGPLARLARPAHPLAVAFGRVALAATVLFALDAAGVVRAARRMRGAQRLGVLGAGALLGAHFALFTMGIDRTSLPAAVSLVSLEPLSVVLAAWVFSGIRPRAREGAGVALATVGAVLIGRGVGQGEHRAAGDLMVLGAVALYGLYVAAARALRHALPAREYAALVYAGAAAALLPCLALPGVAASPMPPRALASIAGLALLPTLVGHTAVQAAARTVSPALVALVSPGETLGGLLIAALVLGAVPSGVELAGAAVIVAGVTVAVWPRR